MQTRSTAWMKAHGGVNGGRSQGVGWADDIRRMTDRDRANVRGSQGADGELMGDTPGSGDQGEDAAMSARGRARVPEGLGGVDALEDQDGYGERVEPAGDEGVERQSGANGSQVRSAGRVAAGQVEPEG